MSSGAFLSARSGPTHPADEPLPDGSRRGSANVPIGNLPARVSSFLGRREELAEVTALLEGSRLVTLTGAPGIGKSRLGLELARELTGDAFDGGWLVELAPITDGALVANAVATTLSVKEAPGESLTDTVIARLGTQRVLLVLDNCEHQLGACTQLVDALLCGCPELRILATSREPLGIVGEKVWQVPPLSVPDPAEPPLPERLMSYDAVSLFVERASAVQAEFSLHQDSAPGVAEISRRLDGIPLAIELAAARVVTLTPTEIARRLDDRFNLLRNGTRSRLPRHQTLQAAVDWSHELLSTHERRLLRRLSVFTGGFCLDAAETVCADELENSRILDVLASLVSKSLLVADTANTTGRYHLLETIRAYAADRLTEADESPAVSEAHARYYLTLAERAEAQLTGPDQQHWFERLHTEHQNLRSAIHWSLDHGMIEEALRLAGALVLFWRVRCHFSEGRELLEATLKGGNDQDGASALRAKALWGVGFMALMAGDTEGARPPLEEALTHFRESDDVKGSARALLILGNAGLVRNDPTALAVLEQSTAAARDAGDVWCWAHGLGLRGYAHLGVAELATARPLFEECLAVAREANDMQGLRYGLVGLGRVALGQGNYGSAEPLLKEALSFAQGLGERYTEANALESLGELALGRGDYQRAEQLLEDARSAYPEIAPAKEALSRLLALGRVAGAQGDRARARLLFEEALTISNGGYVPALQWLGELDFEEGDTSRAPQLFEEVLGRAAARGHKMLVGRALHGLGHVARACGDRKRPAALHNEALALEHERGDAPGIAASLEAIGGLAAAGRRYQHAARLFGAAEAIREAGGYVRLPSETSRRELDLALVRQELTSEEFEAAWAQGAQMSVDEAVIHASKGRRSQGRPAAGWNSLTDTERRVAGLVAENLTNPEIAERLFVARATVKAHLSHIFFKLGVRDRRELARYVHLRRPPPRGSDTTGEGGDAP